MMKRWHWMKHFVRLWSMVCRQLVVGVWVLIGWPCCWLIHRILRFLLSLIAWRVWFYYVLQSSIFLITGGSSLPCHETSGLIWNQSISFSFHPSKSIFNRYIILCCMRTLHDYCLVFALGKYGQVAHKLYPVGQYICLSLSMKMRV